MHSQWAPQGGKGGKPSMPAYGGPFSVRPKGGKGGNYPPLGSLKPTGIWEGGLLITGPRFPTLGSMTKEAKKLCKAKVDKVTRTIGFGPLTTKASAEMSMYVHSTGAYYHPLNISSDGDGWTITVWVDAHPTAYTWTPDSMFATPPPPEDWQYLGVRDLVVTSPE